MSVRWSGGVARIGNRNIGYIQGDTFRSRRNRKKHQFRNHKGFGLSSEALDDLKQMGIEKVELFVTEANGSTTKLVAFVNTWMEQGIPVHYKPFEHQLILELEWFES